MLQANAREHRTLVVPERPARLVQELRVYPPQGAERVREESDAPCTVPPNSGEYMMRGARTRAKDNACEYTVGCCAGDRWRDGESSRYNSHATAAAVTAQRNFKRPRVRDARVVKLHLIVAVDGKRAQTPSGPLPVLALT